MLCVFVVQALDHDMEVAGQTGEAPATQTYEQGQGGPPLMCSTCDLPATRKCLGVYTASFDGVTVKESCALVLLLRY